MSLSDSLQRYAFIPAGIFLFILPITHTVALRLLCLFLALVMVIYLWRRNPPPPIPCKWPLLFWAGICWLSLAWSIDPEYSLGELQNEVGYTIVTFLVFYYLTRNQDSWQIWRNVVLISLIAISTYAIFNYLRHDNWSASGRVGDRNAYSTYLVLVVPFLLLIIFQGTTSRLFRIFMWLAPPLALLSGTLTLNRIMWPTLALVAGTFFILYFRKLQVNRRTRFVAIAASLALCAIFALQLAIVSHKKVGVTEYNAAGVNKSFTTDPRSRIWSYAKDRVAERPITGYGYGRGILRKDFRNTLGDPLYWHAHNMLLNYTLEAGPLGSLALLCLFAGLVREFWKLYRSDEKMTWELGVFGLSLLTGVAIKTITDDIIVRDNALLFWAFVGMALGLGRHVGVHQERPAPLEVSSDQSLHSVLGHQRKTP